MSPAWMMGSQPASAESACGRNRPWVSEIAPMVRLMPDQTTRGAACAASLRLCGIYTGGRADQHGQFVLSVDQSQNNPDVQGRVEAAIDCLRIALRVAPDYVDAMFNLALLLQRTSRYAEAVDYWRHYLANGRQSEWAARARRSLKFCEIQINLTASVV